MANRKVTGPGPEARTKKKRLVSSARPELDKDIPLIRAIAALRAGLDLPTELFSLLLNHLSATKAALLLPDESSEILVPWVYEGLDRTTQHRLRLSRDFLQALPGFDEGKTATIEGEPLRRLKDFLSSREFALVDDLRVTPFFAGDRLVGLLLVVDSQTQPHAATAEEIEAASPAIAAKIDGARAILGNGAAPTRDDALRSRLSTIFAEAESAGYHITAARIDLDRIAGELLTGPTTADLYRFKRDLAGALSTMVSGSGELLSLGDHAVLLLVQSKNPYSVRLLAHQFAEGVRTLIADAPPLPKLTDRTWLFPSGGSSIDEVIDSILE